jgi:hypothetical protein
MVSRGVGGRVISVVLSVGGAVGGSVVGTVVGSAVGTVVGTVVGSGMDAEVAARVISPVRPGPDPAAVAGKIIRVITRIQANTGIGFIAPLLLLLRLYRLIIPKKVRNSLPGKNQSGRAW